MVHRETVITECFWSWTTAVSLSNFRDLDTKGLDSCQEFHTAENGRPLLFYLLLIARFHLIGYNSQGTAIQVLLCSLVVSQLIFGPKPSCFS